MGRLSYGITALAALALLGCAGMPQPCREALKLREEAKTAPAERKSVLEAQAAGLEAACAREHEKSWKQYQENQQNYRRQRP